MSLLLPAVYCGCVRTVIVLWLRRSRGLRALLRLSGICALARWSPPHLTLSYAVGARRAVGKCCSVLAWAALQLAKSRCFASEMETA